MSTFEANVRWSGRTEHRDYPRDALASGPHKAPIGVSTSVFHGGSPDHWNPEELFAASISACHMQTFLALAVKVKVVVLSYSDDVQVHLVTEERRTRVSEVVLQPHIEISADSDLDRAHKFFDKAHKYCIIANSTTATVTLRPHIVHRG